MAASRPLRIAIVAESFLPSVNGVARSVERVLAHVTARGHEVLVVAPGPGPDEHEGCQVVRVPSVPLPLCRDFPLGLPTRELRRCLQGFRPDVVHLASPTALGATGAAVADRLDLPLVAVFQTDLAGFATQYRLRVTAGPIWRWLGRIHGRADRTLAPSRATVIDLRRNGVPAVHRWARGVDLDAFSPAHRTRPPTDRVATVRVGYVGRLAAEKRVDRLAHALRVPGIELVVVGDGPKRRSLERSLPAAAFTGRLTGPALSRAFADLDLFVHTGLHETFCQAAQEALASAVPVVAPAAGGLLDLVEHGRNGWLWRPDRPADLGDAVARLAAHPDLRVRLAAEARASVLTRTWEAIGDELIDHYRAAIRARTRGAVAAVA